MILQQDYWSTYLLVRMSLAGCESVVCTTKLYFQPASQPPRGLCVHAHILTYSRNHRCPIKFLTTRICIITYSFYIIETAPYLIKRQKSFALCTVLHFWEALRCWLCSNKDAKMVNSNIVYKNIPNQMMAVKFLL